jgi:DNA polymerase-3 subunit beta
MDFTISTKEHRAAVEAASDPIPRRSGILPALTLVRIEAHGDGRITYHGTDLEFSVEVEVRGTVAAPGSICLPGHKLAEIAVGSERDGKTRIRVDDTTGVIEAGAGPADAPWRPTVYRLAALSVDDYVGGPNVATGTPITVSADDLGKMAARVTRMAAEDEQRGPLCGVLIETTDQVLRLVATNGHQLALSELPVPGLVAGMQRVVPRQLLSAAVRLLKGRGPVEITLGENSVGLRVAGLTLNATILAGRYPDYTRILPKGPTTVVQLPTQSYLRTLRRMAAVASAHEFKAVFTRTESTSLRLWTRAPDVGTAQDEVEATVLNEHIRVAYNTMMMADVVSSVTAETVRLRLHGPRGGILVDGRGNDDPIRSLWLVMPLAQEKLDCTEPDPRPAAAEPTQLPAAA